MRLRPLQLWSLDITHAQADATLLESSTLVDDVDESLQYRSTTSPTTGCTAKGSSSGGASPSTARQGSVRLWLWPARSSGCSSAAQET